MVHESPMQNHNKVMSTQGQIDMIILLPFVEKRQYFESKKIFSFVKKWVGVFDDNITNRKCLLNSIYWQKYSEEVILLA